MFWWIFWILIAVFVIVGATVLAAKLVGGGSRRVSSHRQDHITALKASGALRHRKSNQP